MLEKHCINQKNATVFALIGELGSGKTTFVQRFARACGIKQTITSPTFVLLKQYGNIIHIDAYRLKNSKELEDLGYYELLKDPENVIFIEWADRISDILPENCIKLYFKHGENENERKISFD